MDNSIDLFGNNFMVVFGWMITDLDLKGNELLVYSVIYGFSQDGAGEFSGSIEYLQKWTNATKKTVISSLNSLQEKGLISKSATQIGKYKVCKYKAVPLSGVKITPVKPDTGVKITPETPVTGVKSTPTGVKITPTGVKSTPNNIGHNIDNNISINNNINNINNTSSTASKTDTSEPTPASSRLTHEQEFERLWNCYPAGRKQGRKKAYACYLRARRSGTSYSEVMEGLKAYLRQITIEKTDIQYVKQGGTWFSGEGWKDEYNQAPPDEYKQAPPSGSTKKSAALAYEQRNYTMAELKAMGIDFGEDVYDA